MSRKNEKKKSNSVGKLYLFFLGDRLRQIWGEISKYDEYICLMTPDPVSERNNKYYFRNELVKKEIIDSQVFGNEQVLTYLNKTSAGQSGGAVIQHKVEIEKYMEWEEKQHGVPASPRLTKHLIGIHVAGYLRQSKCTLFVKANLDWMKSIIYAKKLDKTFA